MGHRGSEYAAIELPEFGEPTVEPEVSAAEYESRIRGARDAARAKGIDLLLVYGDREHSANMTFLTGFDPRFEEALLLIGARQPPLLLVVGNEGMGFSLKSRVELQRRLYQQFSLMGQPRDGSEPLESILRSAGMTRGTRVGVIDWKYFGPEVGPDADRWLCTPAFIVRAIRTVTGEDPLNCTDITMHPAHGMRSVNTVDQLAAFEFAATCTTRAMKRTLLALRTGMSEYEAVELSRWNGMPFSCHPVMASGPRAAWVASPSTRRLELGDPVLFSLAAWGALSARAGFLVHEAGELPARNPRLAFPARCSLLRRGRRVVRGSWHRGVGRRAGRGHPASAG